MVLMKEPHEDWETGCCKRFDPAPWNGKETSLQDHLFVKARTKSFLHIPIGFGKAMKECMESIEKAGAVAEKPLMLCDEKSLWHTDVYIAVSKDMPGVQMARISGTFLCKVFEGPYKDAGKWVRQMREYVESRGKEMKKLYLYHLPRLRQGLRQALHCPVGHGLGAVRQPRNGRVAGLSGFPRLVRVTPPAIRWPKTGQR